MRIEDTDTGRFVEGAEKDFMDSLKWVGIEPDESPEKPGAFGPYRQSEREDLYRVQVNKLIEKGMAYYAFDTPEEIAEMKIKVGETWNYGMKTRHLMKNSFTLPKEEVEKLLADPTVHRVIRFKVPENVNVVVEDLIHGQIHVDSNTIDDKVLVKSDGGATFSLASICDDGPEGQNTSIVLRGNEWLPSSPGHVLLYHAFGWAPPKFAHLPLILAPNSNKKLSKRDGAKYGFPVMVIGNEEFPGFKLAGYEPEAVFNYFALLGFNPGTDREIYSKEELIEVFDISKVSKSSAKFDIKKALWFNSHYLRMKSDDELTQILIDSAKEKGIQNIHEINPNDLKEIARLSVERAELRSQMLSTVNYFFEEPVVFEEKALKKYDKCAAQVIHNWCTSPEYHDFEWDNDNIHAQIEKMVTAELPIGKIAGTLRVITTGGQPGPDLPTIMRLLGRLETYHRIRTVTEKFGKEELEAIAN